MLQIVIPTFQIDGTKCTMTIGQVDPLFHMGTWKCQIESWSEFGESEITVKESEPAIIEFVDLWGEVIIDIGK